MRNIIKDIKAGAVPIVAVLIILVIIIAGIVFYIGPGGSSSTSYWETKNEFGTWGQEIIIGYEDGSTQSLKMMLDEPTLSVWVGDKQISSLQYKLSATATGTGYSSVGVN